MSAENKALVRRFYEEAVSTGCLDNLATMVVPEYTEVFDGARRVVGIDGAKEHILLMRRIYHNLRMDIEQQIAEGEWVVTCYTMRGIHAGEYGGMKPTGKEIAVSGVNVDRVVNGRIVEHGGAANLFHAFLAIGTISVVS